MASAVDGAAVVIGHLPDELRPGKLGQQRAPAIKRNLTVSSALRSRQVTIHSSRSRNRSAPEVLEIAESGDLIAVPVAWAVAYRFTY